MADHANQLAAGNRLACQVANYRQTYPDRNVYLIGHSAGCAVVLAALDQLPPDSIDRAILLAPSVCVSYDLRPALRAARGIDVFYSGEDRWILGACMWLVGTADRVLARTDSAIQGGGESIIAPRPRTLQRCLHGRNVSGILEGCNYGFPG